MGVSAAVPDPALRAIDRLRMRWYRSLIAPANAEYVRRFGRTVRRGPFEGMRYLEGIDHRSVDLIGKVAGTYERELHPAVERWLEDPPALVLNVGCAEGYYAVGLARAIPQTRVVAYDISAEAREQCAEMARLNDVENLQIRAECRPDTLGAVEARDVALFCDCEGYEKELLDPEMVPGLRDWRVIVELHDFVDITITETIVSRFTATHDIELIPSVAPDSIDLPEFDFMTSRQRRAALTERPVPMSWADMRPRAVGLP
jgi:SAM-dependent methyltransferase